MSDENHSEDSFIHSVKNSLSQSEDNIDEITLARLQSARKRAIDRPGENNDSRRWDGWMVPGSAVAATLVVTVTVTVMVFGLVTMLPTTLPTAPQTTLSTLDAKSQSEVILAAMDDMQILGAQEDLELFEELEFFEWLVLESERG